jgi:hypothetical protein
MSAFNRVIVEAECPWCKEMSTFTIPFKYGELGYYDYHLGETLKWGGRDTEGREDAHCVLMLSISENACSRCYSSDEDNGIAFYILIKENELHSVFPSRTLPLDGYLILDEKRGR